VPRGPFSRHADLRRESEGAWLEDVDGNRYIDFAGGIGCRHAVIVRRP